MVARRGLLPLFLLVIGCSTGQAEQELYPPVPPLDWRENCELAPTVVALDEVTPIGFSGEEMLECVAGSHQAPAFWLPSARVYGPESGASTLTLVVSAEPMQVRFVAAEPKRDVPASACPGYVEIDVRVTAQTENGALDESFDATLRAQEVEVAELEHSLDVRGLNGSFAFDESSLAGSRVADFRLEAALTPYGLSGQLSALYKDQHDSGFWEELARFPSEQGCSFGVPVLRDAGEVSVQDALDLVSNTAGVELVRAGEPLEVELGMVHAGAPSCADIVPIGGFEASGVVWTTGVLSVSSADGTIDRDFEVTLEATTTEEGALGAVQVMGSCSADDGPAFTTLCGDYGFDVAGYDGARVGLSMTFAPTATVPRVSGRFVVLGITRPDCLDNPPACDSKGCPACPGPQATELGYVPIADQ